VDQREHGDGLTRGGVRGDPQDPVRRLPSGVGGAPACDALKDRLDGTAVEHGGRLVHVQLGTDLAGKVDPETAHSARLLGGAIGKPITSGAS